MGDGMEAKWEGIDTTIRRKWERASGPCP